LYTLLADPIIIRYYIRMTTFDYDHRYLQAVLTELKDYLLSSELFWPVTINHKVKEPPYPKLTPSNLLLSLTRLKAHKTSLNPTQSSALQNIEIKLHTITTQWQVKWEEKCQQEFGSRLRQWQNFLSEVFNDRQGQGDYYKHEVRLRAQMTLLMTVVTVTETEIAALEHLDGRLRRMLKEGKFIWDEDLAPGFPVEAYWFLYGAIR
jgi:hypothetical protein